MTNLNLSHRIRVASFGSGAAVAWAVFVDEARQDIFMGDHAKGRAIESALSRAEKLRRDGTVNVVVDHASHASVRGPTRLAS
jgi:hypothetical protein